MQNLGKKYIKKRRNRVRAPVVQDDLDISLADFLTLLNPLELIRGRQGNPCKQRGVIFLSFQRVRSLEVRRILSFPSDGGYDMKIHGVGLFPWRRDLTTIPGHIFREKNNAGKPGDFSSYHGDIWNKLTNV